MGYFPMCVDLTDRLVYLLGDGPQIEEKAQRLAPFGARLVRLGSLSDADLAKKPAFVVAGDLDMETAQRAAALCAAHGVAINVVDLPQLCTFSFPSLIVSGDMTISISTGGKAPGAAAQIKQRIAPCIPEKTGMILDFLALVRAQIKERYPLGRRAALMRRITQAALDKGAPLDQEELDEILNETRERTKASSL